MGRTVRPCTCPRVPRRPGLERWSLDRAPRLDATASRRPPVRHRSNLGSRCREPGVGPRRPEDERRCSTRRPDARPSRSTARLMAAYTCGPVDRSLRTPEGSSVTVTAQDTLSRVSPASIWRRTTRTRRTFRECRARAANTRYSAYVRAWALTASSLQTTVIRFMPRITASCAPNSEA